MPAANHPHELHADGAVSLAAWRAEALEYLARFSPSYPACASWGIDHLLATVRHTNPALWAKARDADFWERG